MIQRRIRISSVLIGLGLLVQLLTLLGTHPLAFVAFLVIGCPVTAAGIFFFLWTILTASDAVHAPGLTGAEALRTLHEVTSAVTHADHPAAG